MKGRRGPSDRNICRYALIAAAIDMKNSIFAVVNLFKTADLTVENEPFPPRQGESVVNAVRTSLTRHTGGN